MDASIHGRCLIGNGGRSGGRFWDIFLLTVLHRLHHGTSMSRGVSLNSNAAQIQSNFIFHKPFYFESTSGHVVDLVNFMMSGLMQKQL
jgi:hypothetical protein